MLNVYLGDKLDPILGAARPWLSLMARFLILASALFVTHFDFTDGADTPTLVATSTPSSNETTSHPLRRKNETTKAMNQIAPGPIQTLIYIGISN